MREHLDRVTAGALTRLILELPPRHGKSELATIRYPVYRMERDPELRVILGAYNQTLASRFSRKARKLARERFRLATDRKAMDEWETLQGGVFRAVGVGGGVTGQGANLIIVDDPIKSRAEADSQAYRDALWDWYTNDLYTRQEPGCAIIIIMTRWHQDDLVGRLLTGPDAAAWTRVRLPAEAEPGDPLGRPVGAALCPDRYDLPALADLRRTLGRDYYALYQQLPQPREGAMFKVHWLPLVDAVPARGQRARWWDRASTADGGDWTAGVLVTLADGIAYIEDVVRGRWSGGERDAIIRATAEADRLRFGAVQQWGEQEPGSAGKDQAAAFISLLAGYNVHTEPSTGSKQVRAEPLAAQAEAGNVRILRAPWTQALVDELCSFPSGANDDQVDAAAGAYNKLALGHGGEAAGETVDASWTPISHDPY